MNFPPRPVIFHVRPSHHIDEILMMSLDCPRLGCCRPHADLLPLAERERGCDDPVTMNILRILHQIPECRGQHPRSHNSRCREGYRAAPHHAVNLLDNPPVKKPRFSFGAVTSFMICFKLAHTNHELRVLSMVRGWCRGLLPVAGTGLSGYARYRCAAYRGVSSAE